MHEMGHVLYNAGEHRDTEWNCSSIMGHCNNLKIVQPHDIEDYKDAYQVQEAPNATYVLIPSTTDATHYFEGGYQGGYGITLHQETDYWIDRSTTGVGGTYDTYVGLDRIVDNGDDDDDPKSWEDPNTWPVPWPNAEWCFKTRGQAGGVAESDPFRWGPQSKAYCESTAFYPPPGTCATSAVVTTTDRNGDVYFRVYNFSSRPITNVTITNSSNSTLCTIGSISPGHHDDCHKSRSTSGTARVWWNGTWGYCDDIQYDDD
jgi:hypothetical protein